MTKKQQQKKTILITPLLLILLNTTPALATSVPLSWFKQGHPLVELGGYQSQPGDAQHINIQTLIGDDFTLKNHQSTHALVGLGMDWDAATKGQTTWRYGLNAYFLTETTVSGQVIQESQFTNLAYSYHVTHLPIYATIKATIPIQSAQHALTLEAGIGPNVMRVSGFNETSLDGGITIPDKAFNSHTQTALSATAGIGFTFNPNGKIPLTCGYRFFYLGEGHLTSATDQISNPLNTGSIYANALLCGLRF